jgi:cell division transport system permease protein
VLTRRIDVPLSRDGSARFLPAVIGLMVYLAALAVSGMIVLDGAVDRWSRSLSGTATVQIPNNGAGTQADAERAAVLSLLRATPGIERAELIGRAEQKALLEPWLGAGFDLADLPLPQLVDVRLSATGAATIDWGQLRQKLAALAPGAEVDDHARWLGGLVRAAVTTELAGGLIVLLIGAAAILTVIFTTRTGLSIHHEVIEVLHLIGARDEYVAAQFQWHAFNLGVRGGLAGLIFAGATLLVIGWAVDSALPLFDGPALPAIALPWPAWLILGGLPPLVGAIALLTARLTVLSVLRRMP